jgi:mRNA interferase MazF
MARRIARGDVYLHRFARPDKQRPVVVLSRPDAIEVLHEVIVAPITSVVRGDP